MFIIELKLADLKIGMNSRFAWMQEFCRDYIEHLEEVDFSVCVEKAEIRNELENAKEPVTPEYAECLCLYREIAEKLPFYQRCVVHGAAIAYKENAFLFMAPSGVGKSTHIRLWQQYLGQEVKIVNGDKPILHISENEVMVYGTPWGGKEGWNTNTKMPLKAVCILKRGMENRIEKINPYAYIAEILQQIYMPQNEDASKKTLEFLEKLFNNVSFYVLYCDISKQAVETAYKELMKTSIPCKFSHE